MKRKSSSTAASFNLRVLIGLFVALAGVLLALLGFGTFSNASARENAGSTTLAAPSQELIGQQIGQTTVIPAVHSDLSPPLRDQPVLWPQSVDEFVERRHPKIPLKHTDRPDPVIQNSFWQPLTKTSAVPAPIREWPGIAAGCNGCNCCLPDTSGSVGKTQYVELVTIGALQVFDKLTGIPLFGSVSINSIWSGFGGPCETRPRGDPVLIYDRLADRWLVSRFATPSGAINPQDECIAVSQTGDATGAWYRYGFHLTSGFVDYMKFGVWPDGYYMSGNMYTDENRPRWLGPQPFVFDRAKMLVGDPTATVQTQGIIAGRQTFLPSDLDGILPPPPGDPNHFVAYPEEEATPPPRAATSLASATSTSTPPATRALNYKVWGYHVDWRQPVNSSFTLQASIPAAPFTDICEECVPQYGTTSPLDTLASKLMFRNAYRRFPDGHESLLNNFTVNANLSPSPSPVAGIRWFELRRRLPGNWSLRQERTYEPDNTWRWLGSIASDNQGNVALGFSASSAAIHPQIRYAGRLATDPLNILSGEQDLFDGTGSQTDSDNRWGDYSDMSIDPVDDCTFYYTNEYYQIIRGEDWRTRIGYFRFAQCTPPQKGTAHFVVCDRGEPLSRALVSIDGFTYGATLADGTYDPVLPPGPHTYVVSNPAFATQTGDFTVHNGQTTLVEVCLGGRASVSDFNGDGHPDYVLRDTSTPQTAIWYLNNNVLIGGAVAPTLRAGWGLRGVADFNGDGHPDYVLYNMTTRLTAIWYLDNNVLIGGVAGPTLPPGWALVTVADFNGDGHPDYLLYSANTRQTAIWYLNNNVLIGGAAGPSLLGVWSLVAP